MIFCCSIFFKSMKIMDEKEIYKRKKDINLHLLSNSELQTQKRRACTKLSKDEQAPNSGKTSMHQT